MTAAALPLQDWEQGWQDIDASAIRLRWNAAANALMLLVSINNGNGTFTVHTFNLSGSLRDSRTINTQWPAYVQPANVPSRYPTTSDRDAEAVLADQAKHAQRTSGPMAPPVSGGNGTGN